MRNLGSEGGAGELGDGDGPDLDDGRCSSSSEPLEFRMDRAARIG